MKSKNLIVIVAVLALGLAACKKENKSTGIVGKWYENKLEIRQSDGTAADIDTIFTSGSFTKDDYFQFTSDMKAVFSQSGIFSITGKAEAISGGTVDIGLAHYVYAVTGNQVKLTQTDFFPSNINGAATNYVLDDIVQLDATHLVLHITFFGGAPFTTNTTMYFTRGN